MDEYENGHLITDESFGQWLQSGFPWHEPDKDYLHLRDPEARWENTLPLLSITAFIDSFQPLE